MDILKKVFQSITIPTVQGYDFDKECILNVGQWRVYNGKNKTRLASVWICDQSKQFQIAKKEYTSYIKLKYPGILQVLEPLVEEKSYIAFVTERIECTLSQALNDNKFVISDIEIKLHILEVVDGLQFLHNNVRQAHLDIQPEKIFFTDSGKWKIGGSSFQQQILNNLVDCQITNGYNMLYTAPEILQTKQQCGYGSDIFSLGMIILRLLRYKNNRIAFPETTDQEIYLKFLKTLDLMRFKDIFPESFLSFLSLMLTPSIQTRPTLSQFAQIEWFKDPYLITFNILNKLPEYDMQQQITFFKGLSSVIFNFEKSILKKRLLPIVLGLTQYDHLLTPIVQIILETMRREDILNSQQFQQDVWPKLKHIISGKEIPAQVLYDLVLALPVFHHYISQKEIQDNIIPLLIKCYECKVPKLQDLGIRVTEFVLENNDYTFSKTKILPRIFILVLDQNIEIRKTTLICIYKTLNVMDSELVLQSLEKVKAQGTDRQLNQIVLKIYQSLSKTLSLEQVAQKLLPQITPYLTDPTLSKAEFNEYYDTLIQMLSRIKSDKDKILTDTPQNVISVDYKLALPEPKRILDNKTDQFEFLNQFDQRLQTIPDKPNIQEHNPQQPQIQQLQQQQQLNQQTFQTQIQQPINAYQLGQPIAVGAPINDPFQFQTLQTNQFGVTPQVQQQQQQQQSQQTQFYNQSFQNTIQTQSTPQLSNPIINTNNNNNNNNYNLFQNNNVQNQDPFASLYNTQSNQPINYGQPIIQNNSINNNSWQQPLTQQTQQMQQQQQDQNKKLSQRPMFNSQGQVNIIQPIENTNKNNDPWQAFNNSTQQQDTWSSFQNPVIQNNQPKKDVWESLAQPQSNNLFGQQQQQQQSNKNKYASFDELI